MCRQASVLKLGGTWGSEGARYGLDIRAVNLKDHLPLKNRKPVRINCPAAHGMHEGASLVRVCIPGF